MSRRATAPQADDAEGASQRGGAAPANKAFEAMPPADRERKIAECVRYIICTSNKKAPIKLSDIAENVLGGIKQHGRAADSVLEAASEQLKSIFGLKLVELHSAEAQHTAPAEGAQQVSVPKSQRQYIVLSNLDSAFSPLLEKYVVWQDIAQIPLTQIPSEKELPTQGLLVVILSLIVLNVGQLPQSKLSQIASCHFNEIDFHRPVVAPAEPTWGQSNWPA